MKKIIIITLISFLITFSNANAESKALNIAVINVEKVLKNSVAMKKVQEKMSKKEKVYQSQIDKKQKELEKDVKRIESKRSVLSDSALNAEKKKFTENFNKLKKELDVKQKSLKKAYLEAISKLDKKINEIVAQISKERNIDIIAPTSQLILYKDELDISPEVLKRLNKEMKNIKVNF